MEKNTLIVIPTYNEINSLKLILSKIHKKYNLLVIDDFSNDGTKTFLKKKNINFIRNKKNEGYEKTVLKGLKYAHRKKFKYVLTFDSDGEHNVDDVPRLIKRIKFKNCDLVIANRNRKNRVTEILLSFISQFKYKVSDPVSGLKIYNVNKLNNIDYYNQKKLYLTNIVISFINNGYQIDNINVVSKRRSDKSKVGSIFFTNIKIFYITLIFLFNFFNFYIFKFNK